MGHATPRIQNHDLVYKGVAVLPYKLTAAQEQALEGILKDMQGPAPLDGLLQVDRLPHSLCHADNQIAS